MIKHNFSLSKSYACMYIRLIFFFIEKANLTLYNRYNRNVRMYEKCYTRLRTYRVTHLTFY